MKTNNKVFLVIILLFISGKADPKEQRTYNPIMDFEEFQEVINGKE